MAQHPIVFAMTPRAGRWNHCFLVPDGSIVPHAELARLTEAALARNDLGSTLVYADREVPQTTTGRMGYELLVAHDPRLAQSETVREQIQELLSTHLDQLANHVRNEADWDRDPGLAVPWSGLTTLAGEVESIVQTLKPIRTTPAPVIPSPTAHHSRFGRRTLTRLATLLAVGIVGCIGFVMLHQSPAPSQSPTSRQESSFDRVIDLMYELISKNGPTSEEVQAGDLADKMHLVLKPDEDPVDQVAGKLKADLLPNLEDEHEDSNRIFLKSLYKGLCSVPNDTDVWTNQKFPKKIGEIYDEFGKLDQLGLIRGSSSSDIENQLKAIDPKTFRDIVDKFSQLLQSAETYNDTRWKQYIEIANILKSAGSNRHFESNKSTLNVYNQTDLSNAKTLQDISIEVWKALSSPPSASSPEGFLQLFRTWGAEFNTKTKLALSKDELDGMVKLNLSKFYEALRDLGEACSKLSSEDSAKSTSAEQPAEAPAAP
jgi:hypothetical protein